MARVLLSADFKVVSLVHLNKAEMKVVSIGHCGCAVEVRVQPRGLLYSQYSTHSMSWLTKWESRDVEM